MMVAVAARQRTAAMSGCRSSGTGCLRFNAEGPDGMIDRKAPDRSLCRRSVLSPVETIWQYMRGNWLSNRVFLSYTNILDHCCDAWNKLIAQPWTIMSDPRAHPRSPASRHADHGPTGSDQAIHVSFHQQLQHRLRHAAQKIAFSSSSDSGNLPSVTGSSLGLS
jgi:hypothetical protein